MINICAQSGKVSYNLTDFVLDTEDDVANLPIDRAPGSKAFVIDTKTSYILNSHREWKKIPSSSSGGEGGIDILTKEEIDTIFDT